MRRDEFSLEVYKQSSEDFRQLNQIFWQAPAIIITITGGLGVAVATLEITPQIRGALLVFAGLCNVFWIFILWRLRFGVMERILKRTEYISRQFHRQERPRKFKHVVLVIFCTLLGLSAAGCFVGAFFQNTLFPPSSKKSSTPTTPNVNITQSIVYPPCCKPHSSRVRQQSSSPPNAGK